MWPDLSESKQSTSNASSSSFRSFSFSSRRMTFFKLRLEMVPLPSLSSA